MTKEEMLKQVQDDLNIQIEMYCLEFYLYGKLGYKAVKAMNKEEWYKNIYEAKQYFETLEKEMLND